MDPTTFRRLLGSATLVVLIPLAIAGLQFYGVINMALGRLCFVLMFAVGLSGIVFSERLWGGEVRTKVFVGLIGIIVWGGCMFWLDSWARAHGPATPSAGSTPAAPPAPNRQPAPPTPIPGRPSVSPDTAFHEELPERVTVIVSGNGFRLIGSFATRDLEKKKADGLIVVGDEHPLTIYVVNRVFYVDAAITEGVGRRVIEIKRNNFTVTPPDWDRNYSPNAVEIVNARGQPIFQMIRRRSNLIEISGIFAGNKAIFDARPGKLLFRYPSWKYPGQYANDEDNKTQIDPSLAQATNAELQSKVQALCAEIRVLGKNWNDGCRANLSSATRVADNEHLYRSLEQQFNKDYRLSASSLNATLERRLDSPEAVLNSDDNKIPTLLSSGVAAGPNPFNDVCDYLDALAKRLR